VTLVEQPVPFGEAEDAVMFRADREGFKALDRADSLLALAARRDPRSSLIPLELARTSDRKAFLAEFVAQDLKQGMTGLPDPVTARSAALATVDATLRDHPRNAEGHAVRGVILMGLHRTVGADSLLLAAIDALEQARTLDPRATAAWTELGRAYRLAGRYPESLLAISQAAKVDAFQVHRLDLLRVRFEAALLATDYVGADSLCRAGRSESPGDERFSDCEVELWGRSRSDAANAARAFAITDSLARVERGALFTAARTLWVAAILARAGLGDSADRVVTRALAAVPPEEMRSMLLVEAANIRLLRGDPDSALALIAVAVRMNRGEVPYVSAAPWFDEARKDTRFGAALQGISPREARPAPDD
jgi:tetratricopeptide (TPR) repeat protein